ncbi:MAG: hypothetical protein K0Q63_2879, partial [Paenibacillus sp.]|nr:hypothetical protein [Paenibacillus sp.]
TVTQQYTAVHSNKQQTRTLRHPITCKVIFYLKFCPAGWKPLTLVSFANLC